MDNVTGVVKHLVGKGLISQENVDRAIQEAAKKHVTLITYLVQEHKIDTNMLAKIMSEEFGVPYFDLNSYQITSMPNVDIKSGIMEEHKIFPLFKRGSHLFVAVYDPSILQVLDDIQFQTNLTVEPIVAEYYKLIDVMKKALSKMEINFLSSMNDKELESLDVSNENNVEVFDIETNENDTPIVRFINKVILEAITSGASDIHMEPYEHIYRVRFRQDGIRDIIEFCVQAV